MSPGRKILQTGRYFCPAPEFIQLTSKITSPFRHISFNYLI